MRLLPCLGTFFVLPALATLTCSLHGQPSEEERKRIAALVRQLADDKYAKRSAAGKELQRLGEKALPDVVKAEVEDTDLERSSRARQIARAIMRQAGKSKSLGLELCLVDEITFDMGSHLHEYERRPEEHLHRVRLSRPYLIGKYEVTQAEFEKLMEFNPSWFHDKAEGNVKVNGIDTATLPVERVTWFDAVEFCNRLSERDGYCPYYKLDKLKLNEKTIVAAEVSIVGGNGYRLPTEAEWEAACRAWSDSRFHFGHGNTGVEANLRSGPATGYGSGPSWKSLDRTAAVANYKANHLELHQMHGNVAEWCHDGYEREYYKDSPTTDPKGPGRTTHKCVRGGSWLLTESSCRSASRSLMTPGDRNYATGFRVARTP